jgi:hypothetical protein
MVMKQGRREGKESETDEAVVAGNKDADSAKESETTISLRGRSDCAKRTEEDALAGEEVALTAVSQETLEVLGKRTDKVRGKEGSK